MNNKTWHSLSKENIFSELGSSYEGITNQEAEKRLISFGPNRLKEQKKISLVSLFLEQFKSFLIVILLAATVISIGIGDYIEGIVIFAIVILSALLGFIQNFRAEKALQSLKNMLQPVARIIRSGKEQEIHAEDIVPGDILIINAGDRITADCRILESKSLRIDEAILTGESTPAGKTDRILPQNTSLPERKNMLFTGTVCVYGRGSAIVVSTGMQTEFGKIAASLEEIKEEKTPLQISVDNLGKWLGVLTIVICLLVGALGIARGYPVLMMFIWAIALAVAAVPEALPAVITICLALGTRRMVKRNALVRRLSSVETLGSTSIICSDKTGTLTKGEMTVRKIFFNNIEVEVTGSGYEPKGEFIFNEGNLKEYTTNLNSLLKTALLCNDSRLLNNNGKWQILGDPTEAALIVAAQKQGLIKENLEKDYPRIDEIPFSSERKMMTTIHKNQGKILTFSKGAGEVILERCRLSSEEKKKLSDKLLDMAKQGLRTLAFAYKEIFTEVPKEEIEKDFDFLGFIGMIDPPRKEVKEAINLCKQAGIKTVMITGDHLVTAKVIGKEIGIWDKGMALSGDDLDKISDEELNKNINDIEIIARVSPQHKLRLVDTFQKRGDIVAMTGDGVNDAPALKKADIGVAMGITGTEVSKESSNLILLDDNFATIVNAVEEGRNIFKNTRNFFTYGLSCHIGEILVMLITILAGFPLPLVATQILWMNLITDGLPPMALSVEPGTADIMQRPPRSKNEGFFTGRTLVFGVGIGVLISIQALIVFLYGLNTSLIKGQTMVFCTITISEMFNAFNWRSDRVSLLKLGFLRNKPLLLAVAITVLLQTLVVYVPFLQGPFHTVPLNLNDWILILALGSTTMILMEIIKFIENKREFI